MPVYAQEISRTLYTNSETERYKTPAREKPAAGNTADPRIPGMLLCIYIVTWCPCVDIYKRGVSFFSPDLRCGKGGRSGHPLPLPTVLRRIGCGSLRQESGTRRASGELPSSLLSFRPRRTWPLR